MARSSAVKARSQATNQIKSLIVTGPPQLRAQLRHLPTLKMIADQDLHQLVQQAAPALLALPGVGPEVAGQVLVSDGDNFDRIKSEAAFAHLCGAAPIPASSGRTHRHRLNRGGDRGANNALYVVVLGRLRYDPRTRAYAGAALTKACRSPRSSAA